MGFMSYFQRLDRAGRLFNGMAQRLGADLRPAQESLVGAQAYRSAVMRCANCACPDACAGWQAEHAHADAAPEYCRNRRALEAMSRD